MPAELSIVIPTYNRAAFLAKSLASLGAQNLAPERYEICVVNNGCNDNTAEVVAEAAKKFPRHKIFMVHEPELGLSVSRNTGVRETSAPLVAMAEDDATMPADWAESFVNGYAKLGDELGKLGGGIEPVWTAPPPPWLTHNMLKMLSAATENETEPFFAHTPIMEGNSCYRRKALVEAGGFPTSLGRKGNHLLSRDHMVDYVMLTKGWKIYYDPKIIIHHVVHADRMTPQWMRRRCFWQGVSDFAARIYLKKMGINASQEFSLDLPLDIADWAYINNPDVPPTEADLSKLHSLGLALALSGLIPVE